MNPSSSTNPRAYKLGEHRKNEMLQKLRSSAEKIDEFRPFWNSMSLEEKQNLLQVPNEHIGTLQAEFLQISHRDVNSNWAEMLLKCVWKPVEASAAVKVIEDQSKCQYVVPVDGLGIGNHGGSSKVDSVTDDFCSKDTSDSCLDEGKLVEPSHEESKPVDNESIIENRDHDDILNGELMELEFNEWSKVYSLAQSWPLSRDSEREDLLHRIHNMFKMLLRYKYLSISELNIVIQYTKENLQGLIPKSRLLNHWLTRTPLGICFLGASELKEVLTQLQYNSLRCGFPRNLENISVVNETHTDTQDSEVSERIVLTDSLLPLVLDERLQCNLGNSENSSSSENGATETYILAGEFKGGAFADSDALLSSIFTSPTSAEQWLRLDTEKRDKGLKVLEMLKKEFSNFLMFCQNRFKNLCYMNALEEMESDKDGLQKRKLVERDKITLDAISDVLKEAIPLRDASSSLCDFESGNDSDGKTQDFLEQNDTRIKETIQRQKDAYSLKLSKIDASIMHNVSVRQQLEINLGSVSSHDYQTFILPYVKTKNSHPDLAEKGLREKSDAAAEALLAEVEHAKIHEKSKKKNKKKKKKKKDSKVAGGSVPGPYEETAEKGHDIPIASDEDSIQKMVAGRKPQMSLAESDQQSSNSDDNYRNLGKKDLGGVIFGCTNFTLNECLLNKIFGLPSQHFTYVQNIGVGMPLFLFNFSDRKLHGIYEAASRGQMNLNKHAWSVDGSLTEFPAQVCFDIRKEYQSLSEELFGPIIRENYYAKNLFKFELDHAQSSELISLFKSSPTRGSTSTVSKVLKDAPIHESKDSQISISKVGIDASSTYLEANKMLESHSEKEDVSCQKTPNVNRDDCAEQGMVAGRKPQMTLEESDPQSSNSADNYRNSGEKDLGGVIFSCTDFTMDECFLNKIFGLPSPHFTYVQNIGLGLPLFLFNYSDRKLHGIYVAASQGQMNLNPYAWSVDGSLTQYPAQVRFDIQTECQSLPEKLFKPIIRDNYYTKNHFRFEVDRAQARDLISLFNSSPTRGSTSIVSRVPNDAPIHESKDSRTSLEKDDCLLEAALVSSPDHKYDDMSINNSPNLQSLVNQLRQETRELKDLLMEQLQKTASLERKLMESEVRVQGQLDELNGRVTQLESAEYFHQMS